MSRAAATVDASVRADLLSRAEALILQEDCPILPIFHFVETIAIKPYVEGLYPNARLWFPFKHLKVRR
jgi:ABC-type oligopeptide transport system substrate-binding subunit